MGTNNKKAVAGLEAIQFMMESSITPMSGVGTEIYKIPQDYKGNFIDDLYEALLNSDVIEPFNEILHWNKLKPHKSYWVKAKHINMKQHITRNRLPEPGTMEQLYEFAQRIVAVPLDRSVPLWECHIVEGLEDNHFAICGKGHHAHMDGTTAMARLIGSKSTDPKSKAVKGIWSRIPAIHDKPKKPNNNKKTSKSLLEKVISIGKTSQSLASEYYNTWREIDAEIGGKKFIDDNIFPNAPGNTPFNIQGDIAKSVATADFSLSEVKRIAKAKGCTVNDVYLTLVSGGMYGYLDDLNCHPDQSLVVQMPMSLREPGDLESGNKITTLFIKLGEQEETPIQRLISINADTIEKKNIASKTGKGTLLTYTILKAGSMALTSRKPEETQTANAVVSNVPGSREKLYLMGAELQSMYAFNVLPSGVALMIVGFSYTDSLNISLIAHRSAIPDLTQLTGHMHTSFKALQKATKKR